MAPWIIQSVRKQDAGTYTVVTVKADLTNVSASGQLQAYSECFLSDLGMLKGAVEFCFDRPGWRLHLPLRYVPCWGLNVQCRAHTVETNSKGSDFHSGDLGALQTLQKGGRSEGGAQQRESTPSPAPRLPSLATMTLRKTLQDQQAWPEDPRQSSLCLRGSPSQTLSQGPSPATGGTCAAGGCWASQAGLTGADDSPDP